MVELSKQEINTLCRAIDMNLRRIETIINEVPDLAPQNKKEMQNKHQKLTALYIKLDEADQ